MPGPAQVVQLCCSHFFVLPLEHELPCRISRHLPLAVPDRRLDVVSKHDHGNADVERYDSSGAQEIAQKDVIPLRRQDLAQMARHLPTAILRDGGWNGSEENSH